jgi:hypothetical protein
MIQKTLKILLVLMLAMNLVGAWAFAMPYDCGMACCETSDLASEGIPTYEAPSCCQTASTTCSFETGQYDEFFDEVVCCYTTSNVDEGSQILSIIKSNEILVSENFPVIEVRTTGPPHAAPIYISNLALLC